MLMGYFKKKLNIYISKFFYLLLWPILLTNPSMVALCHDVIPGSRKSLIFAAILYSSKSWQHLNIYFNIFFG